MLPETSIVLDPVYSSNVAAERILRYTDRGVRRDAGLPRARAIFRPAPAANPEPEAFSRLADGGREGPGRGVREDAPQQTGTRGSPGEVAGSFQPYDGPPRADERDPLNEAFEAGFFRRTKAEGDELLRRRNEALSAAKAARATPEEMKAGEAIRSYFTSERDLWGARVNQVLDFVNRKRVPKVADREALSIMREFRNKARELQGFIDGSHPFLQAVDGGPSTAMKHLDPVQPVMRKALAMIGNGMSAAEEAADRAYTKIAGVSLQEGRKGGWLESR